MVSSPDIEVSTEYIGRMLKLFRESAAHRHLYHVSLVGVVRYVTTDNQLTGVGVIFTDPSRNANVFHGCQLCVKVFSMKALDPLHAAMEHTKAELELVFAKLTAVADTYAANVGARFMTQTEVNICPESA